MKMTVNKNLKAIHPRNLPVRIPICEYITWWLLLDRFNVSDFVHGIYWAFVIITSILIIVSITLQQRVDIFEDK